jgi:hypothetical protein
MVQWYTLDGDPDLQKNRQGLLDQYEKTKHKSVVDVNLYAIVDTDEDKNPPATTYNVGANPIPSPTPNPTALINNKPLHVDMVEETSVLEAEVNISAEDLSGIQIDEDAMVVDLLCSLDDDDDDDDDDEDDDDDDDDNYNDDGMLEEGLEILEL